MKISRSLRRWLPLAFVGTLITWSLACSSRSDAPRTSTDRTGSAESTPHARKGPIVLGPGEVTDPNASPPFGETAAGSKVDVAGVRLDMTPEQVIFALKAFDSGLVLSKRYLSNPLVLQYGQTGNPEECTKPSTFRVFSGIIAAEGTTFLRGQTINGPRIGAHLTGYDGCGDDKIPQPGDAPEVISVYLSPQPGNHRVIAVELWKKFKTPSTVEAVLASALKKYPNDFTAQHSEDTENSYAASYQYRFWRFDARGRTMSETVAKENGLLGTEHYAGGLPALVHEGGGIGLDLKIQTAINHDLAEEFSVALYNEGALYKFTGQSKAIYDEIHQKELREETDKAKQSAPPVKM